jgi:ribosomal protein S18 acetylase RimI-like enzyme
MEMQADLVRDAQKKFFSEPLLDRFAIEMVSREELWQHFDDSLFAYYPRDLYFKKENLLLEDQINKLQQWNRMEPYTSDLQDNLLIREKENNTVVGIFHGWQKEYDVYYMETSAIHRDYRRLGIYSALVDRIIGYTNFLGFNTITSCHAPSNNNVLIAKLKKNFKVISLEIDAVLGINLWLCYFHNRELQRAYEIRCGQIDFSHELFHSSGGTADELLRKIEESE